MQDYGRDPANIAAANMPTSVNSVNYLRKRAQDLTATCDGIDFPHSYLSPDEMWVDYHSSFAPPPEPTPTALPEEEGRNAQPGTPARKEIVAATAAASAIYTSSDV